jgi:opacity protein-like surface antigen
VAKTCTIFLLTAATAMTVCLASPPAIADDSGFYVGANIGRILSTYRRTDLDNEVLADFGGPESGYAFDPSATQKDHVMWSASIGYMASRNFGIDASYLHLGALKYSSSGTGPSSQGTGTSVTSVALDIKSRGPAVAALAVLPMSNFWQIDARVGVYAGKTTTTFLSAVNTDTKSGRLSKTSTSLLAGVGTAVTVSSRCALRLDYMRLEHLKEEVFGRAFNVDLVTAGVVFVF